MDKRKLFSKRDLIIVLILLGFSLVLYLALNSSEQGMTFTVKSPQNEDYHINFDKAQEEKTLTIDGDYPLEVHYSEGAVWIENATCPDKVCEHSGKISKQGQSIICIPAGVSVEIDGEDEFDGRTY